MQTSVYVWPIVRKGTPRRPSGDADALCARNHMLALTL